MAGKTTMAQEIILCHLCDGTDDSQPALLHCNPCQVNLCEKCVGKHYMTALSSTHEIVKYTDRKSQFIYPNCPTHKTEKCTVHCQKCDQSICIKCITSVHQGHNAMDLSDSLYRKKEQIEESTTHLENVVYQFEEGDSRIETLIANLISKCNEMQQSVTVHGKEWHQHIDDIITKNQEDIAVMKEDGIKELRNYQEEIKQSLQFLRERVQRNKKIVWSVDASEINNWNINYGSDEFCQNVPLKVELSLPTFVPLKIESVRFQQCFGKLNTFKVIKQSCNSPSSFPSSNTNELLDQAIEIANFPTESPIRQLVCTGEEVWISFEGKGLLIRMNMHGSIQETVISSCTEWEGRPSDISLTKQGELVYTDKMSRTVNIVQDGKSTTFIKVPQGWKPLGVCGTSSGELLVTLTDDTRFKIVRYDGQKIKQEIERDDQGVPLYKEGKKMLFVTENINGDICASDANAKNLVVVNSRGRFRYRYSGQKTMLKEFRPTNIASDSAGRILIRDFGNECIHIIHQDGHFLRSLDNYVPMSVDKQGRLWVGEFQRKKVKIITYAV